MVMSYAMGNPSYTICNNSVDKNKTIGTICFTQITIETIAWRIVPQGFKC